MSNGYFWKLPAAEIPANRGDVQAWGAWLDMPKKQLIELSLLLSPDELARAARLRFEQARWRFIAGRGLLRTLLGSLTHRAPEKVEFEYGKNGKPVLFQASHKIPLYFNVSHSDSLALYAVSAGRPVGIDLEAIHPVPELDTIASQYFSEDERQALLQLSPVQRHKAFFHCWTRKEAYLKARGDNFCLPLNQFSVSLDQPARLKQAHFDTQEAKRWLFHHLEPAQGYVGALVVGVG